MASPPAHPAAVALASLPTGQSARIVEVPAGRAAALAAEGLAAGDMVEVETRQPWSGPVVIRIGHARLALAFQVARGILVEPMAANASGR